MKNILKRFGSFVVPRHEFDNRFVLVNQLNSYGNWKVEKLYAFCLLNTRIASKLKVNFFNLQLAHKMSCVNCQVVQAVWKQTHIIEIQLS